MTMLDNEIKNQLNEYLKLLENPIEIQYSVGIDKVSEEIKSLVEEISSLSNLITIREADLKRKPGFSVSKAGEEARVFFAGVPLGHEFTSLVLALLQVSGRAPKESEEVIKRAKKLQGKFKFETYISLSCHNCPDVVQALNLLSILNPNVTHTMIDGGVFKEEVEKKDILAVPCVYLNGEFFNSGRIILSEILDKIGAPKEKEKFSDKEIFDILIIGGGPAGASAAIYAARKGIRTGIVVERFGGQMQETVGIENFISIPYTEGAKLSSMLEEHVKEYNVDIINGIRARKIEKEDFVKVTLEDDSILKSKAVIIATGAKWRKIGVKGEEEFANKGVAYCPHCDGPLFKDKAVAVIGGGNSGVEAAIDLSKIASSVTVLEFLPELKADKVLVDKLYSLPNVKVYRNVETKEITGTKKVEGIKFADRETKEEINLELSGVFVQIGLVPNTEWLNDRIELNKIGEVVVGNHNETSLQGVFAAGDCTNSAYKQIIISMGSGASAALGAFDYINRNY